MGESRRVMVRVSEKIKRENNERKKTTLLTVKVQDDDDATDEDRVTAAIIYGMLLCAWHRATSFFCTLSLNPQS